MKFFTDKTVENKYLLIKIKDYIKLREKGNDFSQWKEIFIDPGVYELTKSDSYSWENNLNIKEFLDSLPENHYFSADYPSDMNEEYTRLFLDKSWTNAIKFCSHPQYIVTIQFKFNDYWDFKRWFDLYNELYIVSGIMGLGNLCRFFRLNEFMKHTLDYAFSHCKHPRIHIYGLALRCIPYAEKLAKRYNIKLSIDSTKWTRCHHTSSLPSCNKENRQQYFDEYILTLKERGVKIE